MNQQKKEATSPSTTDMLMGRVRLTQVTGRMARTRAGQSKVLLTTANGKLVGNVSDDNDDFYDNVTLIGDGVHFSKLKVDGVYEVILRPVEEAEAEAANKE